jgi:hypothetical protein
MVGPVAFNEEKKRKLWVSINLATGQCRGIAKEPSENSEQLWSER